MTAPSNSPCEIFREFQGEHLQLVALSFTNGYFLGISKKDELKLGTMALSLPFTSPVGRGTSHRKEKEGRRELRRGELTTTTLLGSRNEAITKALAEKVVQMTNKLVYLSVNFPENDQELFVEALQLVDQFLREESSSKL